MTTSRSNPGRDAKRDDSAAPVLLEHEREVLEALRALQFGTLEIIVHQSRIVQITRSEKVRF
ncbi:MAG: YezD family protein [Thermomonas sp.]